MLKLLRSFILLFFLYGCGGIGANSDEESNDNNTPIPEATDEGLNADLPTEPVAIVMVSMVSDDSIQVSWDDYSGSVNDYLIYYSKETIDPQNPVSDIIEISGKLSTVISGLEIGTEYFFRLSRPGVDPLLSGEYKGTTSAGDQVAKVIDVMDLSELTVTTESEESTSMIVTNDQLLRLTEGRILRGELDDQGFYAGKVVESVTTEVLQNGETVATVVTRNLSPSDILEFGTINVEIDFFGTVPEGSARRRLGIKDSFRDSNAYRFHSEVSQSIMNARSRSLTARKIYEQDGSITFAPLKIKVPYGDHLEFGFDLSSTSKLAFSVNVGWTGIKSMQFTNNSVTTTKLTVTVGDLGALVDSPNIISEDKKIASIELGVKPDKHSVGIDSIRKVNFGPEMYVRSYVPIAGFLVPLDFYMQFALTGKVIVEYKTGIELTLTRVTKELSGFSYKVDTSPTSIYEKVSSSDYGLKLNANASLAGELFLGPIFEARLGKSLGGLIHPGAELSASIVPAKVAGVNVIENLQKLAVAGPYLDVLDLKITPKIKYFADVSTLEGKLFKRFPAEGYYSNEYSGLTLIELPKLKPTVNFTNDTNKKLSLNGSFSEGIIKLDKTSFNWHFDYPDMPFSEPSAGKNIILDLDDPDIYMPSNILFTAKLESLPVSVVAAVDPSSYKQNCLGIPLGTGETVKLMDDGDCHVSTVNLEGLTIGTSIYSLNDEVVWVRNGLTTTLDLRYVALLPSQTIGDSNGIYSVERNYFMGVQLSVKSRYYSGNIAIERFTKDLGVTGDCFDGQVNEFYNTGVARFSANVKAIPLGDDSCTYYFLGLMEWFNPDGTSYFKIDVNDRGFTSVLTQLEIDDIAFTGHRYDISGNPTDACTSEVQLLMGHQITLSNNSLTRTSPGISSSWIKTINSGAQASCI